MDAGRELLDALVAQEGNPIVTSFGYRQAIEHDGWTEYVFEWVADGDADPMTDILGNI